MLPLEPVTLTVVALGWVVAVIFGATCRVGVAAVGGGDALADVAACVWVTLAVAARLAPDRPSGGSTPAWIPVWGCPVRFVAASAAPARVVATRAPTVTVSRRRRRGDAGRA